MASSSYLDGLRGDLAHAILERDALGLTDVVADRLNRLECAIAWEERRLSRRTASPSWLSALIPPAFSREFAA